MGLLSHSMLNSEGICHECELTVHKDESLQCDECKHSYHVFCEGLDTGEKHCTKTFLTQFIAKSTRKPNFSWKCDPCAIQQDNAEKTDLAQIVHRLASKVEALTTTFDDFKQETKQDNMTLTNTFDNSDETPDLDVTPDLNEISTCQNFLYFERNQRPPSISCMSYHASKLEKFVRK